MNGSRGVTISPRHPLYSHVSVATWFLPRHSCNNTGRNSATHPTVPTCLHSPLVALRSSSHTAGGALLRFLSGPLAVFACAALTARPAELGVITRGQRRQLPAGDVEPASAPNNPRRPPQREARGRMAAIPPPPSLASIAHTCPAADERRGLRVSVLLLF
ncbi:hypothetical protein MRX96_052402 [Rhipicephalus microplus]